MLPGDASEYSDLLAMPGTAVGPSDLAASADGNTGVRLSWSPASFFPGPEHRYRVIATFDAAETTQSNEVTSRRSAPMLARYEVTFDGGASWLAIGTGTTYSDVSAPKGTFAITAAPTAIGDEVRGLVELDFVDVPLFAAPVSRAYKVRAIAVGIEPAASAPSTSESASRAASAAPLTYTWQREEAGNFVDLSESTVAVAKWFDSTPTLDAENTYRVAIRSPGSETFSGTAKAFLRKPERALTNGRDVCVVLSDKKMVCSAGVTAPTGEITFVDTQLAGSSGHFWLSMIRNGEAELFDPSGNPFGSPPPDPLQEFGYGFGVGSCGIKKSDSTLACWSAGTAPTAPTGTFVQVGGTCALRSFGGGVACWDGGAPPADAFIHLGSKCGVRADNRIVCWGTNTYGQSPPGPSADLYTNVFESPSFGCGLLLDGAVKCWGDSNRTGSVLSQPSAFKLKQVMLGSFTNPPVRSSGCGISTVDDRLRCWGAAAAVSNHPVRVSMRELANFADHGCGLSVADTATCFGRDDYGQTRAPPGTFVSISVGGTHTCGLRAGGSVVCWGDNSDGQCDVIAGTYNLVSAGLRHTCARQTNGSVVCWGNLAQPPPPYGFKALSSGNDLSCGILMDDSVTCWGTAPSTGPVAGQKAKRVVVSSFTSAAAPNSNRLACAIDLSNSIVCWGDGVVVTPPIGAYKDVRVTRGAVCGKAMDDSWACNGNPIAALPPDAYDVVVPGGSEISSAVYWYNFTCGIRTADKKLICTSNQALGQAQSF